MHEEYSILKENVPFGEEAVLNYVTEFLQQAHMADERYTVRDGINIARYVTKIQYSAPDSFDRGSSLHRALLEVLGEEAFRYAPRL